MERENIINTIKAVTATTSKEELTSIETAVKEYNTESFNVAFSNFTNDFSKFFVIVDGDEKLKAKGESLSYNVIVWDITSPMEYSERTNTVNVKDFITVKLNILSSIHADGKATAKDKREAKAEILAPYMQVLPLLHKYASMKVGKDTLGMTYDKNDKAFNDALYAVKKWSKDNGKENPFTSFSNTALQTQAEYITSVCADVPRLTKVYMSTLYDIICRTNKYGAGMNEDYIGCLEALARMARLYANGISVTFKDKQKVFKARTETTSK